MTTAASRPGGKFGGKFSGRGKTSLPSSSNASSSDPSSSSNIGANNHGSTKKKITMEMIKSKRSKIKRHEVFDKLDQAESIVLDILNIAKDTSKGFEFLASPHVPHDTKNTSSTPTGPGITADSEEDKSTKMEVDGDDTGEEEGNEEKIRKAEQEWKHKIRHNGKSYMEKLKKIHELLLPHSDLVVNYGNIAPPREGNVSEKKTDNEEEKTEKKKTNMYASRLEMRLAIDKKNLLSDLVELEKKMLDDEMKTLKTTIGGNNMNDNNNVSMQTDANTNKRKREDP